MSVEIRVAGNLRPGRPPARIRAHLFTALGAALGMLATLGAGLAKQAGQLEGLSLRYVAGTAVPPLLAVVGLSLYGRRPWAGATLVVVAAGLLVGTAAVGSGDGTGLLWMPGALLLTKGAYGLVTGLRRTDLSPGPSPEGDGS